MSCSAANWSKTSRNPMCFELDWKTDMDWKNTHLSNFIRAWVHDVQVLVRELTDTSRNNVSTHLKPSLDGAFPNFAKSHLICISLWVCECLCMERAAPGNTTHSIHIWSPGDQVLHNVGRVWSPGDQVLHNMGRVWSPDSTHFPAQHTSYAETQCMSVKSPKRRWRRWRGLSTLGGGVRSDT